MPGIFNRPITLYGPDITNWSGNEDNQNKTMFYVHFIFKHSVQQQKKAVLIGTASKDDIPKDLGKKQKKQHRYHPDTLFFTKSENVKNWGRILKQHEGTKWSLHSVETDCKSLPCSGCFQTIRYKMLEIVGSDVPVRCFQQEFVKAYYVFQTGQDDGEIPDTYFLWHW